MGGSPFALSGSRIANATRTWQAAEDAGVVDWVKTNDFIFAIAAESGAHAAAVGTLQIRWRNKTDEGSFAVLSGSGELTWSGVTDLVNDNAVTSGEAGCTGTGTWVDGVEREGANDVTTDLAKAQWTEHQWAVDCSGAHDGDEYEFELYDATEGAAVGTCAATITMEAGAQTFYQNVGQGSVGPLGTLAKKGFVNTGGHSMVLAGTLVKKGFVDVGGHAMVIAGTLATVRTICIDVGGYAMTIAGTLVKKGFVNAGGHAMTIVGTLIKKGFKDCGGHSMTITGDCDPKAVIGQLVGQGAVAIAGVLQTVLIRGCAVGGGVVNIAGTLLKKISISVGGGTVSPVGTLQAVLLILQNVGQGTVSIAGDCVGQFIAGGEALNLVIWRVVSYLSSLLMGLVTKHKDLDDIDLE